jgi:hypothetical protein
MDVVMKMIHGRRRGVPEGAILLEDGKKVCEGVICTPGTMVKVSEQNTRYPESRESWTTN